MNKIFKLTKFNLYVNRKAILGWSICVGIIMFIYMILYPSIQEMAQAELDAMPEALLQLFGMSKIADLSNYTTYYGMIFDIALIVISVFAATFSANLIVKEEKTKSIEFLSTLSVSKKEIYISKYITSLISISILLFIAVTTVIICGLINGGETFNISDILNSSVITCFTAFFFGGIGIFLAGILKKVQGSSIFCLPIIISYFIGYLAQLLNEDVLFKLSPFISFNVSNVLILTNDTIVTLIGYIIIYIVLIFTGCLFYNKRDLNV